MARLKTGPKIILIILLVVGFVFGLRKAAELGWIPTPGVMKALVPEKALLPDVKDALVQNVDPVPLPTSSPASVRSRKMKTKNHCAGTGGGTAAAGESLLTAR